MRGIALEGGGAKGSFHVGAIKALKELGISYEVVAGTSIGAVNGAFIALDQIDQLEQIWLSSEAKDMMAGDPDVLRKIVNLDFRSDQARIKQFISDTLKQGGIDITPFKAKLRIYIDEERLRNAPIGYGLVTVSVTDLKPVEVFIENIPQGELHDYIIASANVPVFKDERIDHKRFIDGAFFDNLPINMLLAKGCDEVIAIRIGGFGITRRIKKADQSKVITIMPSEDLGKLLEIDPVRAAHNINLGYYDTMRVMKKLHGTRYYIKNLIDEKRILQPFLDLKPETLEEAAKFLGLGRMNHRVLFETIIPLMADLLKVDKDRSYSELLLRYYEFLAEEAGIDRFEIMTYESLIKRVNTHYLSQMPVYISRQDEIVKRIIAALPGKSVLLFPQKLKNDLLIHVATILMRGLMDGGKAN